MDCGLLLDATVNMLNYVCINIHLYSFVKAYKIKLLLFTLNMINFNYLLSP